MLKKILFFNNLISFSVEENGNLHQRDLEKMSRFSGKKYPKNYNVEWDMR